MNIFNKRHIIITGGSSGVGRVLAGRLAERGAHMALIARDPEKLESVAAEVRSRAGEQQQIACFSCDVADAGEVETTFERISSVFGMPHMLINSAGILEEGYFETHTMDDFRQVMDVNFFGTLHCIRAALPCMKTTGGGRIVNIASVAGLIGVFGYTAYCASKHAIVGLTAALRMELKPQNIRIHLVCPPEFDSPMVDAINADRTLENEKITHTIPVMTAEAVADAVIRGVEQNRFEIIPGVITKALTRLNRHFPGLGRAITDAKIRKYYQGPNL